MAVWLRRHRRDVHALQAAGRNEWRTNMWSFADRVVKAVSDVTVGTVIVLVHVALADRQTLKALRESSLRNEPRRLPS